MKPCRFDVDQNVWCSKIPWFTLRVLGINWDGIRWAINVTDREAGGFWQYNEHELEPLEFSNGTWCIVGSDWVVTYLPNGKEVHAHPNAETPEMVKRLHYPDVESLTREHDVIHSALMDWLGQPYSYSLMQTAGEPVSATIAAYEEDAVLAIQKLKQALRNESLCTR